MAAVPVGLVGTIGIDTSLAGGWESGTLGRAHNAGRDYTIVNVWKLRTVGTRGGVAVKCYLFTSTLANLSVTAKNVA